jgi:hypothetical protein
MARGMGMGGPGMGVNNTLTHQLIMTPRLRRKVSPEEFKRRLLLPEKKTKK